MQQVKWPFYARLAMILLSIVLIIFLLSVGKTIFIPLFFALLISVLLFPVTRFFEQLHFGRIPSALITVFAFVFIVGGLIYLFSIQIVNFSNDIPRIEARMEDLLHDLQHWISRNYHVNISQQM